MKNITTVILAIFYSLVIQGVDCVAKSYSLVNIDTKAEQSTFFTASAGTFQKSDLCNECYLLGIGDPAVSKNLLVAPYQFKIFLAPGCSQFYCNKIFIKDLCAYKTSVTVTPLGNIIPIHLKKQTFLI
ncbi:hypothetical protein [Pedobacter antarcticus]|uniref:hypothetical protein n=1 Tax=Pedobacter antarcticus TaxID=34086 RepID=UPI000880A53D|nr:hypothetical protein [Pedobacter antarcticus]SDM84704.1 hypothetical protein SAMN04488084_11575 [Pedobacter antarcticus]